MSPQQVFNVKLTAAMIEKQPGCTQCGERLEKGRAGADAAGWLVHPIHCLRQWRKCRVQEERSKGYSIEAIALDLEVSERTVYRLITAGPKETKVDPEGTYILDTRGLNKRLWWL